jgi:hypothetical protein
VLEKGSWMCLKFEVPCLMAIKYILLLSIAFNWVIAVGDLSAAAIQYNF